MLGERDRLTHAVVLVARANQHAPLAEHSYTLCG